MSNSQSDSSNLMQVIVNTQVLETDVVVVGGGLTGLAAAIGISKQGFSTLHLAPKGVPDQRTSALMMPTIGFLQAQNLIDEPGDVGHPLTQIRIIDATNRLLRAPETLFDSSETGLAAFGWNFANQRLLEVFEAQAEACELLTKTQASLGKLVENEAGAELTLSDGSIVRAKLVVGADGKRSSVRAAAGITSTENQFDQSALVCDLDLARPIGSTSIEFHYAKGPFTFVPAGNNRANLVWIDDAAVLERAKAAEPEQFVRMLAEKSERLFGAITVLTKPQVFPLSALSVKTAGKGRFVLVGDAAHAFPPIGAQGLNLGLRDVADLIAVIGESDRGAVGWAQEVSAAYARRRAGDLLATGTMVDTLFKSLLAEMLPTQALRASGLWALRLSPQLRKRAFGIGMGIR